MVSIFEEARIIRNKIKKGPANKMLMQKPFAEGMYLFTMFIISYYSRVREKLKLDYDSFMIVQTTITHKLYNLKNNKNIFKGEKMNSYQELELEWEQILERYAQKDSMINSDLNTASIQSLNQKINNRLSIASICLVTALPKETVRRKTNQLVKKNILKITKKDGVIPGPMYTKIFQEFVPQTTLEISKLLKRWEKNGILKNLLDFKV